jgi:hypothetical protein
MRAGNGLRIVSFFVQGNHGFVEVVTRFHLTAEWIFFSVLLFVHLFSIYRETAVCLIRFPQSERPNSLNLGKS